MDARSFPPVARRDARVLILGSMPGVASLRAQRYYAHPRNQFWPIVARLFGVADSRPYRERLQRLRDAGVALWDVLAQCRRPGSLDSQIDLSSARANDFAGLLRRCPHIHAVFFNGQRAEQLFRRMVMPQVAAARTLALHGLPSTSPAHASLDFDAKLVRWRAVTAVLAETDEA